jgi:hypothetical protein
VTTTAQKVNAVAGGCSLEEAIYSANFNNNIAARGAFARAYVSSARYATAALASALSGRDRIRRTERP